MCISIFNYQNRVNGERGGKQESGCVQEAKEFVNFFNKLDKYIKSFLGKDLFLEFFFFFQRQVSQNLLSQFVQTQYRDQVLVRIELFIHVSKTIKSCGWIKGPELNQG